jgi:hypothetical protein
LDTQNIILSLCGKKSKYFSSSNASWYNLYDKPFDELYIFDRHSFLISKQTKTILDTFHRYRDNVLKFCKLLQIRKVEDTKRVIRRTDTQWQKRTKGQTTIYNKTLHRKLKIEQHKPFP